MKQRLLSRLSSLWPVLLIAIAMAAALFYALGPDNEEKPQKTSQAERVEKRWGGNVPWSALRSEIDSPRLVFVELEPIGVATLRYRDGSQTKVNFPSEEISLLAAKARQGGARVEIQPLSSAAGTSPWVQIVMAALLVGGVLAIFFYWQRMGSGEKRTRNDDAPPEITTRFNDVAGCGEAVEEVQEFVLFLRDRERFLKTGARMPSGAVLYGPPGTGKTLLARALAGEAGVPFYHMAGSEAVNKYVGVGASTVRDLFRQAKDSENGAVVFIDEIDAIGKQRSGEGEAASREHDNTLNQLLVELDGFSGRERVVVLGATNRLDTLDPALLRPGRLSRQIPVLPPDEAGRLEILQIYAEGKPLHPDVDLPALAAITSGSTGADLADMVNEAAIQAARDGREEITDADLREGHLRALAGPERASQSLDPEERRKVAFHEAGHVLAAELCPEHDRAERVTIVARGQAAGMAVWGQRDRALHSPEYVHQRLIGILGGRAAERVQFGTVSSGAANDLQQANELARVAIEDWGLSQTTGQLLSRSGHAVSDQTRSLVDQEVEKMVADAFRDAVALLEENKAALGRLAEALLQNSVLERVDILQALGDLPPHKIAAERTGPSLNPVLGSLPSRNLRQKLLRFLRKSSRRSNSPVDSGA